MMSEHKDEDRKSFDIRKIESANSLDTLTTEDRGVAQLGGTDSTLPQVNQGKTAYGSGFGNRKMTVNEGTQFSYKRPSQMYFQNQ